MAYKSIKRYSISLDIREMKIKTTVRYHYTLNTMDKMKGDGKQKMLARVWSNP